MTSLLDTRLSNLRELPTAEQVHLALSTIINSANGEAPLLFSMLENTPAKDELAGKIVPETGLMTVEYFKQQVASELVAARAYFENTHLIRPLLYSVMVPKDVTETKAYLKTNNLASTKIIGHVDGLVAALFEANYITVKEVFKEHGLSAYGVISCTTYSRNTPPDVDRIHRHAKLMLKPNLRLDIALNAKDNSEYAERLAKEYLALKY